MNYLRNLLRRLWPFVTRRELLDVARTQVAVGSRLDTLEHRIQELELRLDNLRETVQELCEVYITNNTYKISYEDVWQVAAAKSAKKKPSRKKPAKKGKKK